MKHLMKYIINEILNEKPTKDKELSAGPAVETSLSSMVNNDTVQTLPYRPDSPPNNPQLHFFQFKTSMMAASHGEKSENCP